VTGRTQQIDGEFWFTAKYAASLLGTSRKKVEAMALRDLVRSRPDHISFLIAETDVTRLRRDPKALAEAKKAAAMPGYSRKAETMPSATVYKGDPFPNELRIRGRIGNPLKDQRAK
jgi:hypothetical protein